MDIVSFDISIDNFYGTKVLLVDICILVGDQVPDYLLEELKNKQAQDRIDYKEGKAIIELKFTPIESVFILEVIDRLDNLFESRNSSTFSLKDIITVFKLLQVLELFDVENFIFLD